MAHAILEDILKGINVLKQLFEEDQLKKDLANQMTLRLDIIAEMIIELQIFEIDSENPTIQNLAGTVQEAQEKLEQIRQGRGFAQWWSNMDDIQTLTDIGNGLHRSCYLLNVLLVSMSLGNSDLQRKLESCEDSFDQLIPEIAKISEEAERISDCDENINSYEEGRIFYYRYFGDESTISIQEFLSGMIEKLSEQNPAIHLTDGQKHLLQKKADISHTGEMTQQSLQYFFEYTWPNLEHLLSKGAKYDRTVQEFGPLYTKDAQIQVVKVVNDKKDSNTGNIKKDIKFKLGPEGFRTNGRRLDRITKFGKRPRQGVIVKDDIQFSKDELMCGRKQAQIVHRSNGYFLREMNLNGHTRIQVKKGMMPKLEKFMALSFGNWERITVMSVDEEEERAVDHPKELGQKRQREEVENMVKNAIGGDWNVIEQGSARARNKLKIFVNLGKLRGKQFEFSSYDAPIKISRAAGSNRLTFPCQEVSRDHGQFIYDGKYWYYKIPFNEKEPLNGTWISVSDCDPRNGYINNEEGTLLQDSDRFMIGLQEFQFDYI